MRGRTTHFVGRAAELRTLAEASTAAAGGDPRVVVIGGEAGVGKSRLATHFLDDLPADGVHVLSGSCVRVTGRALPFAAVTQMLQRLCDDIGLVAVHELGGPAIGALAGPLPGEAPSSRPVARQAELFADVLKLLDALGRQRPTVIFMEDVHWADRSTLDLLTFVVRGLRRHRVLLVLTHRSDDLDESAEVPGFLAELVRLPLTHRVELHPLDHTETAALLGALRGEPADAGLVRHVSERSAGNPFFIEELVSADATEPGAAVPPTLRDVVRVRLDRVGPDAGRLLEVIAVAAQPLAHRVAEQVAELDSRRVAVAAREAVAAGVLVADAQGDYGFRHDLARQCVLESLLPAERRDLHARLAAALAASGATGGDAASTQSAVAHHWFAAQVPERALDAAVVACQATVAVHAYPEAREHGEQALGLWEQVPSSERPDMALEDLLELTASATRWSGDAEAAAEHVERAITLTDPASLRRAALWERLGRYRWVAGDPTGSLAAYEEAGRLLESHPAGELHARVDAAVGNALMLAGRYGASRGRCEQAVALAQRVGATAAESHARIALGVDLAMLGDVEAGTAELVTAGRLAEEAGSFDDRLRTAANLSYVLDHAGRLPEALEVADRGLAVAREYGRELSGGGVLCTNRVSLLLRLGRWEEAALATDDALGRPMPRGFAIYLRLYRAELDLARGRYDDAEEHLRVAHDQAAGVDEPQYVGQWCAASAELAWWRGRHTDARHAVDLGLAAVDDSEEHHLGCRLIALGLRTEADAMLRAEALRDDEQFEAAQRRADGLLALLPAVDGKHEAGLHAAWARLEHARGHGRDDPGDWRRLVEGWEKLQQPYRAACARWRWADALVRAGDRERAGEALRAASDVATTLGAGPLAQEIVGLGRRARVTIDEPAAVRAAEGGGADPSDRFDLTPRERDVLPHVADGCTNREIARRLFISEKTASVHVSNIIGKLGVRNRSEVAAVAHRLGMVSNDEERTAG